MRQADRRLVVFTIGRHPELFNGYLAPYGIVWILPLRDIAFAFGLPPKLQCKGHIFF